MALYEFALACADEPETHRKKEGDIIAVKPHPWIWGCKELTEYLIVILDGLTKEEALRLTMPQYNIRLDWYPSPEEEALLMPVKIAKRRFNLPLEILRDGWVTNLDTDRVRAKDIRYQPLINDEIIIDTREHVSIVFDKHRASFRYRTRKKI